MTQRQILAQILKTAPIKGPFNLAIYWDCWLSWLIGCLTFCDLVRMDCVLDLFLYTALSPAHFCVLYLWFSLSPFLCYGGCSFPMLCHCLSHLTMKPCPLQVNTRLEKKRHKIIMYVLHMYWFLLIEIHIYWNLLSEQINI